MLAFSTEATVELSGESISVHNPELLRDEINSLRIQWTYTIRNSKGREYVGNDLFTPHYVDDAFDVINDLISFLEACQDSQNYPDGENADLFPKWLMDSLDIDNWAMWRMAREQDEQCFECEEWSEHCECPGRDHLL